MSNEALLIFPWHGVESAETKEDVVWVVNEVPEASGRCLQRLYLGIVFWHSNTVRQNSTASSGPLDACWRRRYPWPSTRRGRLLVHVRR